MHDRDLSLLPLRPFPFLSLAFPWEKKSSQKSCGAIFMPFSKTYSFKGQDDLSSHINKGSAWDTAWSSPSPNYLTRRPRGDVWGHRCVFVSLYKLASISTPPWSWKQTQQQKSNPPCTHLAKWQRLLFFTVWNYNWEMLHWRLRTYESIISKRGSILLRLDCRLVHRHPLPSFGPSFPSLKGMLYSHIQFSQARIFFKGYSSGREQLCSLHFYTSWIEGSFGFFSVTWTIPAMPSTSELCWFFLLLF